MLTNKPKGAGLKVYNDSKAFIEYSNDMDDNYENIEEYSPNKKHNLLIKLLIILIITIDMLGNKKLNPIVTELFIRGRRLNISLVFITQSYFDVRKNIRLNSTRYLL